MHDVLHRLVCAHDDGRHPLAKIDPAEQTKLHHHETQHGTKELPPPSTVLSWTKRCSDTSNSWISSLDDRRMMVVVTVVFQVPPMPPALAVLLARQSRLSTPSWEKENSGVT